MFEDDSLVACTPRYRSNAIQSTTAMFGISSLIDHASANADNYEDMRNKLEIYQNNTEELDALRNAIKMLSVDKQLDISTLANNELLKQKHMKRLASLKTVTKHFVQELNSFRAEISAALTDKLTQQEIDETLGVLGIKANDMLIS